jgi:hypothetical protein
MQVITTTELRALRVSAIAIKPSDTYLLEYVCRVSLEAVHSRTVIETATFPKIPKMTF